jgi:hypothetical protein
MESEIPLLWIGCRRRRARNAPVRDGGESRSETVELDAFDEGGGGGLDWQQDRTTWSGANTFEGDRRRSQRCSGLDDEIHDGEGEAVLDLQGRAANRSPGGLDGDKRRRDRAIDRCRQSGSVEHGDRGGVIENDLAQGEPCVVLGARADDDPAVGISGLGLVQDDSEVQRRGRGSGKLIGLHDVNRQAHETKSVELASQPLGLAGQISLAAHLDE